MRPRSMTGFGRGEASEDGRTWVAEIRTVNHRYLDQRIVLPRLFGALEEPVKRKIAAQLDRGRVEVTLSVQGSCTGEPQLAVNEKLATQYHRCLQQLIALHGLQPEIRVSDMLGMRDVINFEESTPDIDTEWEVMSQALDAALDDCDIMREREGQALKKDLQDRLERFAGIVSQIERQIPEVLQWRITDLQAKLGRLLDGMDLDPVRLAQEAAILADKCDVTEEITRLGSHIHQFHAFLVSDEPVGRRLDFLLQEFLREVNTLSSKISNASIAHLGVEMKNEIEKIREQVQNIE